MTVKDSDITLPHLTLNVWFVYINNNNLKIKGDISRFNNSLKSFLIIDSIKSFTRVQHKHKCIKFNEIIVINSFQHTKGTLRSRRTLFKPKLTVRRAESHLLFNQNYPIQNFTKNTTQCNGPIVSRITQ